jgi:hypothetical protein
MSWPEDQDPVQQFAAQRSDDALADRIRPGRPRRCPDDLDVFTSKTSSKASGYLLSRSRIRNRNVSVPIPRSIARFRACWTTHAPVGLAVTPATCNRRVPCSMKINTYSRRNSTVSTCRKSQR